MIRGAMVAHPNIMGLPRGQGALTHHVMIGPAVGGRVIQQLELSLQGLDRLRAGRCVKITRHYNRGITGEIVLMEIVSVLHIFRLVGLRTYSVQDS